MNKSLMLAAMLLLVPLTSNAATGTISDAGVFVASGEMNLFRGYVPLNKTNGTGTVHLPLDFVGGQAYDASAVPCREANGGKIVLMGFSPDMIYYKYNPTMTQMETKNPTPTTPWSNLGTQDPKLVWSSPVLPQANGRNMRHWMGGCFWDGSKYAFPVHSENYFRPASSTHEIKVGRTIWDPVLKKQVAATVASTVNVPNIVTLTGIKIQGTAGRPSMVNDYLTLIGGDQITNVETARLAANNNSTAPYDGAYYGGYDLSVFSSTNGISPTNNSFNRNVIISRAPPYTVPANAKLLGGDWCKTAGFLGRSFCPLNSAGTGSIISTNPYYGGFQFSNFIEYTGSDGVGYVVIASEHRPVGNVGFYGNSISPLNSLHSSNAGKPVATRISDPTATALNPYTHSEAPILFRAPKASMYTAGAWQVFGWDLAISGSPTKANARWVPICATCTIDASLPITTNNLRPYLFFVDQQNSQFGICTANGNMGTNCSKYDRNWGSALMQSIKTVNGKYVQFGADSSGNPYFSYTTSFDTPLQLETTLTRFTRPDGTPIPGCYQEPCVPHSATRFSLHSGKYLSVADLKSANRNLSNFVPQANGVFTGSLFMSIRGGYSTVTAGIKRYDITLSGL